MNPFTHRAIIVGGRTFTAVLEGAPRVDFVNNQLVFTLNRPGTRHHLVGIEMQRITNPSDGNVEPRHEGLGVTDNGAQMLQDVIDGNGGDLDWDAFRGEIADAWYGRQLHAFTFGPYHFTAPTPQQPNGTMELLNRNIVHDWAENGVMPLLANEPVRLPFTNVLLNSGDNDSCVDRFLGLALGPEERTPIGIIRICERRQIPCKLYDVWGGVWFRTPRDMAVPDDRVPLSAVVYAGHIYPTTDGGPPMLISRPIHTHEDATNELMFRAEQTQNALYFQRGQAHYIATPQDARDLSSMENFVPDGVHVGDPAMKEWMDDLIRAVPRFGWDFDTLRILKEALHALHKDTIPTNAYHAYTGIDMDKCYYNCLKSLAKDRRLWTTSVFCRWQPVTPDEHDTLIPVWNELYLLSAESAVHLEQYGIRSNLVTAGMLSMLRRVRNQRYPNGHVLRATHRLRTISNANMCKDIDEELAKWEDHLDWQKEYAVVNGIFGRISNVMAYWFSVNGCTTGELQHYAERYGFQVYGGELMNRTSDDVVIRNRFHIHAAVVLEANEQVLRIMLENQTALGILPSKIKVDSLIYPTVAATMRPGLRTPPGWHVTVPTPPAIPVTVMPQRLVNPSMLPDTMYENCTYIGPPGTGKTHAALRRSFDIAVCYSNKGARRVGGHTIHSAFMVWDEDGWPSFERVKDAVVFVDEAQCVSRKLWAMFYEAYLLHNTRFIFAMDLDQLPPVNEPRVQITPFHGEIIHMTTDYRNDDGLQSMRALVLDGLFRPMITRHTDHYTRVNIAYFNRTCKRVNELLLEQEGRSHGDDGIPYIAKNTSKRHGWMKNEMFRRTNGVMISTMREDFRVEELDKEAVVQHFHVAYCTTIHKQIGETIVEPFTIWDACHPLFDKPLMYTAVTRAMSCDQITFRV